MNLSVRIWIGGWLIRLDRYGLGVFNADGWTRDVVTKRLECALEDAALADDTRAPRRGVLS